MAGLIGLGNESQYGLPPICFHRWNSWSSRRSSSLPSVTVTHPMLTNNKVRITATQNTTAKGNMFDPLRRFQNSEIAKHPTKMNPNIRAIRTTGEGWLLMGKLLHFFNAIPVNHRKDQAAAWPVAVIIDVERKMGSKEKVSNDLRHKDGLVTEHLDEERHHVSRWFDALEVIFQNLMGVSSGVVVVGV
ncbi:MAG: hypothetical protein U0872_00965 [Planctomycetaceae bacterium]